MPLASRPAVVQTVDELDVGALGRSLWRKKLWIVGLTLVAAGLAFVAVNLITPRYKSEARVLNTRPARTFSSVRKRRKAWSAALLSIRRR